MRFIYIISYHLSLGSRKEKQKNRMYIHMYVYRIFFIQKKQKKNDKIQKKQDLTKLQFQMKLHRIIPETSKNTRFTWMEVCGAKQEKRQKKKEREKNP